MNDKLTVNCLQVGYECQASQFFFSITVREMEIKSSSSSSTNKRVRRSRKRLEKTKECGLTRDVCKSNVTLVHKKQGILSQSRDNYCEDDQHSGHEKISDKSGNMITYNIDKSFK